MVFHILPALAVAGVKYVIKEATDAPTCGKCGREKMKMWAGFKIIFLCEDCEDGMKVKLGLKAVQVATFGVRTLSRTANNPCRKLLKSSCSWPTKDSPMIL